MIGPNNETKVLQFRYNITPRSKTNAFKPKPLEGSALDVRYSQLGGCFSSYNTLLRSSNVGVIWEAGASLFLEFKSPLSPNRSSQPWALEVKVSDAIPAVITPLKPKYYLLCKTVVKANTAVKLT